MGDGGKTGPIIKEVPASSQLLSSFQLKAANECRETHFIFPNRALIFKHVASFSKTAGFRQKKHTSWMKNCYVLLFPVSKGHFSPPWLRPTAAGMGVWRGPCGRSPCSPPAGHPRGSGAPHSHLLLSDDHSMELRLPFQAFFFLPRRTK